MEYNLRHLSTQRITCSTHSIYVHSTLHDVAAVSMRACVFEISVVTVFSLQSVTD